MYIQGTYEHTHNRISYYSWDCLWREDSLYHFNTTWFNPLRRFSTMTKSYSQRLQAKLEKLAGKPGSLNKLVKAFRFTSGYRGKVTTCLCGKKHLKLRFRVHHTITKKSGVVGSKCVKLFKRRKGYSPVVSQQWFLYHYFFCAFFYWSWTFRINMWYLLGTARFMVCGWSWLHVRSRNSFCHLKWR